MPRHSILVRATWDPEANVWVATSDDVPGLITEAETQPALIEKLHVLIPELLAENGEVSDDQTIEVPLYVMAEHVSRIRISSR